MYVVLVNMQKFWSNHELALEEYKHTKTHIAAYTLECLRYRTGP